MSRIVWDTMLFVYLLESADSRMERVRHLLQRSRERGDFLFTSYLAYGEMLAGARKVCGDTHLDQVRTMIPSLGFSLVAFDAGAVESFTILRSQHKVKVADAIHLACAASVGVDLFLTGDRGLIGLDVQGIGFVADYTTAKL